MGGRRPASRRATPVVEDARSVTRGRPERARPSAATDLEGFPIVPNDSWIPELGHPADRPVDPQRRGPAAERTGPETPGVAVACQPAGSARRQCRDTRHGLTPGTKA
jgi:hypothetical protein